MSAVIVIIAVITLCMVVWCCFNLKPSINNNYDLGAASFDADQLNLIATNSGIVFPPDSQGQNILWRGRQIDPSFMAKIEITTNSIASFSNQLVALPNQSVSFGVADNVPWWKPSKETTHIEKRFLRGLNQAVHIILCRENGRWMLYVEWMSV